MYAQCFRQTHVVFSENRGLDHRPHETSLLMVGSPQNGIPQLWETPQFPYDSFLGEPPDLKARNLKPRSVLISHLAPKLSTNLSLNPESSTYLTLKPKPSTYLTLKPKPSTYLTLNPKPNALHLLEPKS